MCGIAGFVDTSLNGAERNAVLEKMLVSIAHRGPDARGAWYHDELALGHNRLSILDLSEDGKQPMHFNNFSIVFNGEIYNFSDRNILCCFQPISLTLPFSRENTSFGVK